MPRLIRNVFLAFLLLFLLISLPFWLRIVTNTRADLADNRTLALGDLLTQEVIPALRPSDSNSEPEKITLVDAGWFTGSNTPQDILHPPAIIGWNPAQNSADWRWETEPLTSAFADGDGRIYFVEQQSLIILDEGTGEVLNRLEMKNIPESRLNADRVFPIGRQGNRLYFRNYNTDDNLFIFDLQTGLFDEERWTLCEGGYPFDSTYLAQSNTFITFCYDFATGTQGVLTQLSIADGTSTRLEMPVLGPEDYMVGNGFAVGTGDKAYVVDSDAGALVEIDLNSMLILRQASYRQASLERSWFTSSIAWLLDLAAKEASAKRWMSQPVISPDGAYLVVDGGFGIGGGATTSAWLIDLENLNPVKEIKLPRSPEAFHFTGDGLLFILLVTEMPENSQLMVFDLASQETQILDVPSPGRVNRILH